MIEYLYRLIKDADRLDVTPIELASYINRNAIIIKQLKFERLEQRHNLRIKTQNPYMANMIGGGDPELADLIQKANAAIKDTDASLALGAESITKFNEGAAKRNETLEIAKLATKFLDEISNIVGDRPEYPTLAKQVREITNIIGEYDEPVIQHPLRPERSVSLKVPAVPDPV